MFNLLVTNYRPFLNGAAGLSLVPSPLQGEYNPQSTGYQWVYAAGALLLAVGAYLLVRRVTESPYGRSLRAMRDNDLVADSLGKNLLAQRAAVLVLGGALAGLSGGILVGYVPVGAVRVGLRRDDRAVRGRDHRRCGQSPRRRARRDPGARRFRGSHQVHPPVRPARPRRGPAVGGDRPADPGVPLVPPAGRAARAPPSSRRRSRSRPSNPCSPNEASLKPTASVRAASGAARFRGGRGDLAGRGRKP